MNDVTGALTHAIPQRFFQLNYLGRCRTVVVKKHYERYFQGYQYNASKLRELLYRVSIKIDKNNCIKYVKRELGTVLVHECAILDLMKVLQHLTYYSHQ